MTASDTIEPGIWRTAKCFIVCGGPSVADHDLARLNGHRVIVVNSSFQTVPQADYLVFADKRWWEKWCQAVVHDFRGRVVALTPMKRDPRYTLLTRKHMSGLYPHHSGLALHHTTVTAAINLACHLMGWEGEIGLLGLDGQDRNGKSWHHEPHPWKQNPSRYEHHAEALSLVARALPPHMRAYNCNPAAAHTMFPHRSFKEMTQ